MQTSEGALYEQRGFTDTMVTPNGQSPHWSPI
jgi:hypothetical protein